MAQKNVENLLQIFKALSDRNRVRLMAALSRADEICACQLTELLGVTGATTSRHLALLQNAGLITSRKEGRWNLYSINKKIERQFPLLWLENLLKESVDLEQDRKMLETILAEGPEVTCQRQRGT